MIIGDNLAKDLRALKEQDSLQINGLTFEVVFVEDIPAPRPSGKSEVMDEGMRVELKKDGSASFSLVLTDIEICYTLERVLDGPAPLNSNPDILFEQDVDADKTSKYRISRRQKDKISLAFFEGETEVGIKSFQLIRN